MPTLKCSVCGSTTKVYKFPQCPTVYNSWIQYVIKYNPKFEQRPSSGICQRHFTQNDLSVKRFKNGKTSSKDVRSRLKPEAVPSDHEDPITEEAPSDHAAPKTKEIPSDHEDPITKEVPSDHEDPITKEIPSDMLVQEEHDDDSVTEVESSVSESSEEYNPNSSFLSYAEKDLTEDMQFNDGVEFDEEMSSYQAADTDDCFYIVSWQALLQLFLCCRYCKKQDSVSITKQINGAGLRVEIDCSSCNQSYSWASYEVVKKRCRTNLLLCSAILFCGGLPTKVLRILTTVGISVPSVRTFFRYQKYFLNNAVSKVWKKSQQSLIENIKATNSSLSIAGDARCDSMGHSAKYACYSILDACSNKVLSLKLIQSQGNSNAMELIGFKEALHDILVEWKLRVHEFTSDRHMQIRKYMRETYGENRKDKSQPLIHHYFDLWHCAKSLKKQLNNLTKLDSSGLIAEWTNAIVNHFYWIACSTPATLPNREDVMIAKWHSMDRHIINRHSNHDDANYKSCDHPRRRKGEKKKKYMTKDSPEHVLICDLVRDNRIVRDLRQLSPNTQTSALESFHAVVNHFAPKMIHFHYLSMLTRTRIAALHFNCNSEQYKSEELRVTYLKYKKGKATVRKTTNPPCFDYIVDLMNEALLLEPDGNVDTVPPPPMTSLFTKASGEEKQKLLDNFSTRFNTN